jgi:hypothetical protein
MSFSAVRKSIAGLTPRGPLGYSARMSKKHHDPHPTAPTADGHNRTVTGSEIEAGKLDPKFQGSGPQNVPTPDVNPQPQTPTPQNPRPQNPAVPPSTPPHGTPAYKPGELGRPNQPDPPAGPNATAPPPGSTRPAPPYQPVTPAVPAHPFPSDPAHSPMPDRLKESDHLPVQPNDTTGKPVPGHHVPTIPTRPNEPATPTAAETATSPGSPPRPIAPVTPMHEAPAPHKVPAVADDRTTGMFHNARKIDT